MKSQTPPAYIAVHGPPRSGKTLNSAALAAYFGCDEVFDGAPGPAGFQIHGAKTVLWLCNTEHLALKHTPFCSDAAYIPVHIAAALLGDRWVNPAL
jgi:hypothetical protein